MSEASVAVGPAMLGGGIAWGTHPMQSEAAPIGALIGLLIGNILALLRTHPRKCPICKTRNLGQNAR